ncbi:MAG TPA: adenylate/guanylate cyclase domain-containing protein [Stellaceae bacterium]|nr:adenylate/guanylate cyclase domain-containing protein [Stellaceae bacterium]
MQRLKRRLAAILVIGGGATPRDEEGSYAALGSVFAESILPLVAEFDGHVAKRPGETTLAEFASVIDAARCALAIQAKLSERNRAAAADRRVDLRIGINLGDIIVEEDDIYGDGINIAARLEALAEPGSIYVSGIVADQIAGKIEARLTDLGQHRLKNIERPVQVYRLAAAEAEEPRPAFGAAPGAASAMPDLAGPSAIAVLPFANFSGDPEQEYFADGITEDIISTLAVWKAFPVIARNSTFTFKGRDVDVKQVGRELGARYVLEGSVRRVGSRVRVAAQLIDAERGDHLMADKWDREITDLFALQDEIVLAIVGAIAPELLKIERERHARAPQRHPGAYDCYQRGLWHHYKHTKEDNLAAQAFYRSALAAEPEYPKALAALAHAICNAGVLGWAEDAERNFAEAFALAERAVALDGRDPAARFIFGLAAMHAKKPDLAIAEMEQAIALNPSYSAAHVILGQLHNYAGRPADGIRLIERGMRLSPRDPRMSLSLLALAGAYYQLGRYEEAVEAGRRSWALNRSWSAGLRYVVAGLGQLGRKDEAAGPLQELRRIEPDLGAVAEVLRRFYQLPSMIESVLDGLRKAGMT